MKENGSRISAAERARIRRLRTKYRKRMLVVGIIFFILGIVAGIFGYRWIAGGKTESVPASVATPVPEQTEVTGGFLVEEPDAPTQAPDSTEAPAPTEVPEPTEPPAPTEPPKPVIHVPVTEEPTEEPVQQPVIHVPQTDAEPEPESGAEPAPEAGAEAGQDPLPLVAPEAGGEDALPAVEPTEAPDMTSGDVAEMDPSEGEVPVEYMLDQEQLADPEKYDEAVAALNGEDAGTVEGAPSDAAAAETSGEPQVIAIVPYGESYTYTTQIKQDGSARLEADDEPYETIRFTQTMKDYMRPSDFAKRYATEYRLTGDEAGASFELELKDYVGNAPIIPQNLIDVGFCSATGNTVERGYQLMDAAMGGNYDVALDSDVPKTLYKRYAYTNMGEEMEYLVVTTYNGGLQQIILFQLESDEPPEPEIVYPTMQRGLKNDDVKAMQQRLIELGYMERGADGDFGPATEKAVKAAQEDFGMEANGIADNEFQQRLYEGMEQPPIPGGTAEEEGEAEETGSAEAETDAAGSESGEAEPAAEEAEAEATAETVG